MTEDVHNVVFAGYDAIADAYLEQFDVSAVRQRWMSRLIDSLPTPDVACSTSAVGPGSQSPAT